ncbi:MAG: hypothetical protein K2U26_06440, partial [Cyclobacteriaceae bacterium]|nr:hypothetical protein [Cyclobacteriaceae bacterium]
MKKKLMNSLGKGFAVNLVIVMMTINLYAQSKSNTENIILITFDGMRWQEVFGGAEKRLITKKFLKDSAGITKSYWAETPEQR